MKKTVCLLLALFLLFPALSGAEDTADGNETHWVKYNYDELTVGNATPLMGKFFTEMFGGSTTDADGTAKSPGSASTTASSAAR